MRITRHAGVEEKIKKKCIFPATKWSEQHYKIFRLQRKRFRMHTCPLQRAIITPIFSSQILVKMNQRLKKIEIWLCSIDFSYI